MRWEQNDIKKRKQPPGIRFGNNWIPNAMEQIKTIALNKEDYMISKILISIIALAFVMGIAASVFSVPTARKNTGGRKRASDCDRD